MSVSGIINTFAGNGTNKFGGDGGPAVNASFNVPYGVCVFGNLVYVMEYSANRVRKIDASTGIITTLMGNGLYGVTAGSTGATSSIATPHSCTFNSSSTLLVSSAALAMVVSIDTTTGRTNVIATASASLTGLWLDPSNYNLYIAETYRILILPAGSSTLSAFAGQGTGGTSNGQGTSAQFNTIRGITGDTQGGFNITSFL